MIKFRNERFKFIIFGRSKNIPTLNSRKLSTDIKIKYDIDFKIRFPYKYNNEEKRYMFSPVTLSLFLFGIRTGINKENPTEFNILLDDGQNLFGNFLVSKPFTIKKQNKNNVEYENRRILLETSQELNIVEVMDKTSNISTSFELFDIKIKKI